MAKRVNWPLFEAKIRDKNIPLLTPTDVMRLFGVSRVAATFLLYRYTKRGLLTRCKRGLYAFSHAALPDPYLANRLYEPSYVSLEFALSYHRVIPETVYAVTSVTTKSTRSFVVSGKRFIFQRIKKQAFTGYAVRRQQGLSFLIAEPEKAYVDLLYLRLRRRQKPLRRFRKEKLDRHKAVRYAKLFENPRLTSMVVTSLRS